MNRNIRRAMTAAFGLALIAMIGLPALAQDDMMMSGEQSVAADFGKGCCEECCCSGTAYGEFQYLRLSSYDTDGAVEGSDSDDGYRIVLGYERCDGLGLRVRYFDFDGVQDNGAGDTGLDLSYFDVEVTQSFCLCSLEGVVSAGYRHADHEVYDDGIIADFKGDGITMGLNLQRDVSCNMGLFLWTQHSILFGEDDQNDDDYVISWTEAQLGAQYSTCVGGMNTVVRGGVEAQFHAGTDNGQDAGVLGWFLSAGVTY